MRDGDERSVVRVNMAVKLREVCEVYEYTGSGYDGWPQFALKHKGKIFYCDVRKDYKKKVSTIKEQFATKSLLENSCTVFRLRSAGGYVDLYKFHEEGKLGRFTTPTALVAKMYAHSLNGTLNKRYDVETELSRILNSEHPKWGESC